MPAAKHSPACPICGKPADPKLKPFCSRRCADVDLNRWLGEVYTIASDDSQPAAGTGLTPLDDED